MSSTSQKRAVKTHRERLRQRGMGRFEVLGLDRDRALIRSLARRLAENDVGAVGIREKVRESIGEQPIRKGGILEALRRSPLAGAELDLKRRPHKGREIDL